MEILQYPVLTTLTGTEQFLFANVGGDPANTITAQNLANYVLTFNAYATGGTNIGNSGVGIYSGIAGGLLRFNNIAPGSDRVTASIDSNHNILIDIDLGNIMLPSLGGNLNLASQVANLLPVSFGGTNANNAVSARSNLGAASAGSNTDITSIILSQMGLLINSSGTGNLNIVPDESLSVDRILNLILLDANKTLTMVNDSSISGINTGDQTITLTGDVTGSGTSSFSTFISANVVDLSKMAQLASQQFIGRNTSGTGDPEYLDQSTAKSILGLNINSNRSYVSQSLSFSTPRTPSTTQDTLVIATLNSNATTLQTGTFDIQVNTGSGFVTIASINNDNEATTTQIFEEPTTFIVPANSSYQILESGTATNTITSVYELTL